MKRVQALEILGLGRDPTTEDVERAYEIRRDELEARIAIAPTDAIRQIYREALDDVSQAREILSGDQPLTLEPSPESRGDLEDEPAPPQEPAHEEPEPVPTEFEAEPQGEPAEEPEEQPEEPTRGYGPRSPDDETVYGQGSADDETVHGGAPGRYEDEMDLDGPTRVDRRAPAADDDWTIDALPGSDETEMDREVVLSEDSHEGAISDAEAEVGFLEGRVLAGRFEIRRRIGMGLLGAVYAAHDRTDKKLVAIKVFRPHLLRDEQVRERFLKESGAWSYLSHKNIVRVFDVIQDGHLYFVSMELLEGKTVRETIDMRRGGRQPSSIREVENVGRALGDALAYAHQYTVHGHIKPENIFLSSDGSVKLMEFGLTALALQGQTRSGKTPLGYTAPEAVGRGEMADHLSDQYSVAAILYEMLTGSPPASPAPPVRSARGDVPLPLATALDRALQRSPSHRFPDMEAFARALSGTRTGSTLSRHSGTLVLAIAAVVLTSGGILGYRAWRAAQTTDAGTPGETPAAHAGRQAHGEPAARPAAERAAKATEDAPQDTAAEAERKAAAEQKKEAEINVPTPGHKPARQSDADRRATAAADALRKKEKELAQESQRMAAARAEAEQAIAARAGVTATAKAQADAQRTVAARAQADAQATMTAKVDTEARRLAEVQRAATARARSEAEAAAAAAAAEAATAAAEATATARAEAMMHRADIPAIDASIVSLRFFEKAPDEVVGEGRRQFSRTFPLARTRGVFWELSLTHPPAGQRRHFKIHSVCLRPDGEIFAEGDLNSYVEENWGKSTHLYGWGFPDPGKWPQAGAYTVQLFVDGRKVATGSFSLE